MRAARYVACVVGGFLASCGAGAALAGAISVSPTRIELSPTHPMASLELRNDGDSSVTLQIERVSWSQQGDQDVYSPSNELIATPTVFDIAPHGTQVLRIAVRGGSVAASEHAFRLYATEVSNEPQMPGAGLHMSLRIGIPVFAESPANKPRIEGALLVGGDGSTIVRLRNTGERFARALRAVILDADGTVLWQSQSPTYLLANSEHSWTATTAQAVVPGRAQRLSIVTETGTEDIVLQPPR